MSVSADVRSAIDALASGEYLRAADLPGSPGAVATALSRECGRRRDIVRVRKGLYWKGVSSRFGAGRPDELESAVEAAGKGAGPAGWSALSMLGLTTQVPKRASVAVVGRQMSMAGLETHKRSNLDRTLLSSIEIAVLEVLRDEWYERARKALPGKIEKLIADGLVDPTRLARVARGESSLRVRERVSALAA